MSQLEIIAPFRAILTAKLNIYFQTPNNYEDFLDHYDFFHFNHSYSQK